MLEILISLAISQISISDIAIKPENIISANISMKTQLIKNNLNAAPVPCEYCDPGDVQCLRTCY